MNRVDIKWIEIVDYPNYVVGDNGRIKNVDSGRVLSNTNYTERGYCKVNLSNSDGVKTFRVHGLVARHFIANPFEYKEIDHRDEDKTNNAISNLRWCSRQMNMDYYYENNPERKAVPKDMVYGSVEQMVLSTGKRIVVNGITFHSCGLAAQHILERTTGKKKATISKELRNMVAGKRSFGTMYCEFSIEKAVE